MHRLSLVQALALWTDLEAAYYGEHGYGSDTAEVYLYRFMPYSPSGVAALEGRNNGPISSEVARDMVKDANEALHNLLVHYALTREAHIEVDGRELGPWLKTAGYSHRVPVKVVKRSR